MQQSFALGPLRLSHDVGRRIGWAGGLAAALDGVLKAYDLATQAVSALSNPVFAGVMLIGLVALALGAVMSRNAGRRLAAQV